MSAVIQSGALASRHIPSVVVTDMQKATAGKPDTRVFDELTNPNSRSMRRNFQELMVPKSRSHTWPSTNHDSSFEQFASMKWLLTYYAQPDLFDSEQAARLTCLIGDAGSVVACESEDSASFFFGGS